MSHHQLEVRVLADPKPTAEDKITVLIICNECGTREEFEIIIGHLTPVISTLESISADMGLKPSKPPTYSSKEVITRNTPEEILERLRKSNKN